MAGIVELLPKEFGFVVLTIIAYCILNAFMQIQVGRARKKYNVPYPILYATETDSKDYKIYNCIQRGHQNSLEALPIFFVLMVLGGLKFPITCSVLGVVYIVSRFFYFTGYASGDPKGRLPIGCIWFTGMDWNELDFNKPYKYFTNMSYVLSLIIIIKHGRKYNIVAIFGLMFINIWFGASLLMA